MASKIEIIELVKEIDRHLDPDLHDTQNIQVCHDETSIWVNIVGDCDVETIYCNDCIDDVDNIKEVVLDLIGETIGETIVVIDKDNTNNKIIKKYLGFVQSKTGDELLINTLDDEIVKITIKNKDLLKSIYCKHVKITVEELTGEEFDLEKKISLIKESDIKKMVNDINEHLGRLYHDMQDIQVHHDKSSIWVNHIEDYKVNMIYRKEFILDVTDVKKEILDIIGEKI